MKKKRPTTSWETSNKWYKKCVGEKGHYYHQKIVIPKILQILESQKKRDLQVLDLACGQGILERSIPKTYGYCGLDISPSFIEYATDHCKESKHTFKESDITQKLPISQKTFDVVCLVLALQNIENPEKVFRNAHQFLKKNGKFIAVLNHPCFRIPRQSSWEIDKKNKIQYRRVNRYMSEEKIPIQTHPSQKSNSPVTYAFHNPLSRYFSLLNKAGFVVEDLQEWCSDKKSQGSQAKIEDRARMEFPLFLTWIAKK